jgi:hypothetical protein
MSRLFARLGSAFVTPPPRPLERTATGGPRDGGDVGATSRIAAPPRVAILCRPGDALVVGGAVALTLAARGPASPAPRHPAVRAGPIPRTSLVAVWGAGAATRAPAVAGARRLATTIASRGHTAAATGKLAIVALAGTLSEASAEAARVDAAAGDVPVVTVLAGPRDATADALLRDQDLILVALPADGDEAVADLALDGLAPLGVPARALRLPPAPAAVRGLAASGVAVLPPLRAAVEAALEGQP